MLFSTVLPIQHKSSFETTYCYACSYLADYWNLVSWLNYVLFGYNLLQHLQLISLVRGYILSAIVRQFGDSSGQTPFLVADFEIMLRVGQQSIKV